ncbi:MAG: cysteine--tRNA ligase [Candidatus Promineifilaceae bacterium]|nr:cysteine--tRNA ligase [Candidatus Promineifilaceae bacterium]
MQLYNVLTRRVETFEPAGSAVSLYVCGITPYDTTHLGHLFTYTSFDVLVRYLEYLGHTVRYVQNVTDIDDDILRKADSVEADWQELGNRWTRHFIDDNVALNIRPPDYFPRATDVVAEMLGVVEDLLIAGLAYEVEGSVYFQVGRDPDYGQLSGLDYEEMLPVANERGNHPDDPNKRDPLDFVLWQAQAPGEPAWDSPWGPGRPGWHIECSTMATKYLGLPVDIHGGGADLIFPHHESEIAQAEYATGHRPFSRYWLHTAMVRHEGEKMSKSLGNLVMVRDLLEAGWSADALRLYMAGHHYRDPWSHDDADLARAAELARRLEQAVGLSGGDGPALSVEMYRAAFQAAMDNDLDTAVAGETLTQLASEIEEAAEQQRGVEAAQDFLREAAAVLGLRLGQTGPEPRVQQGWTQHRQGFAAAVH